MELSAPGWRSGPLLLARSRRRRWRGLRPRPQGRGLLLAARSVHTWGMREALRVASLDASGRVRQVALLLPGRVFADLGARWILELPMCRPGPVPGVCLKAVRRSSLAADGRVCWHT